MQNINPLPRLFGKASNGKVKIWEISAIQNEDGSATIRKEYGYIDGKKQIADVLVKKGKNLGKKNETTPFQQAIAEAQSEWNSKKDENYVENINDLDSISEKRILPMRAQTFRDSGHRIKYPCYVQPKMNGVRCLVDIRDKGDFKYISRSGKTWELFRHLDDPIKSVFPPEFILDGEIYHPDYTFQQITRFIRDRKPETSTLQFWIYDIITSKKDEIFENRWSIINSHLSSNRGFLVKVPTILVYSENEIYNHRDQFIKNGFEGIIIRNMSGLYSLGYKSPDLQKDKIAKDAEWRIIGGYEGKGRFSGCCTFICETKDGKKFHCCPKGTIERKKEYFTNLNSYIGKMLTIEYEDLSDEGIPLKPVGIEIRDYE